LTGKRYLRAPGFTWFCVWARDKFAFQVHFFWSWCGWLEMKEGGYAEGGMKMRTRSETEGVRAGGVDSQMSMRKYYRPKSEADRKRRDHERMLKNRELANIANARKKKRIEEIQEANRSLKEESRLLDETNQRLEEQIKLAYQKL